MLDPKIETLLMVNQTLNFTRAGERLSLTQPAYRAIRERIRYKNI